MMVERMFRLALEGLTIVLLLPRADAMALLMAGVLLMALNSGPKAGDSTAASCWSKGSLAVN